MTDHLAGALPSTPPAMRELQQPWPKPRWPHLAIEPSAVSVARRRRREVFWTCSGSITIACLLATVILRNLAGLWIWFGLEVAFLSMWRFAGSVRRMVRGQELLEIMDASDAARQQMLALMSAGHRTELERLENMVEYIRHPVRAGTEPLGNACAERLDVLLYHYARVAVEHRRTAFAFAQVAADEPSVGRTGRSSEYSGFAKIAAMRREARKRCGAHMDQASEALGGIGELVRLCYEQSLARSLPVSELIARLDDTLEDVRDLEAVFSEVGECDGQDAASLPRCKTPSGAVLPLASASR